jgi:hypothetical protein
MTVFNPVWRVKIQGVEYTTYTLSNLTISSGRNNIYQQAQAGYCNLELLNLTQAIVNININDSVTIELQDSTNTYVPIFGGTVVDFGVEIITAGSVGINQVLKITALGALSRLPKALTDGVLTQDFDGDQIWVILQDLLLNNWGEVPAALTWAAYDPTETWANAQNVGLGEIDRPGNYELAQRASDRVDIYSLVSALATSGLGYIYEDASGLISYADSTHRSIYLATNGYTDLTANHALFNGLKIETRAGDVRNDVTLKYGTNSSNEVSAEDIPSIDVYGRLAQVITTTVKHAADAQDQADFYLTLRATPQANFTSITYQLTNPELDDLDRDSLINIFMGLPLRISDLPPNMSAGTFLGFVEGWTFKAAYNEIAISLNLSPLSYSLQALKWEQVPIGESWNTISGALTWETALVVA